MTKMTTKILMSLMFLIPFVESRAQTTMNGDKAQLLFQHYGLKASGNPPAISRQPKPDETAAFGYYTNEPFITTVDTTFVVGGSELIVFFRTQMPRDAELMFCEECSDRLDVARMGYDANNKPTVKQAFIKGFIQQGTLEGQARPELVVMNNWPVAVKITATTGYMENNTRTEHYYSFPELKPILEVNTREFLEERGGPDGPMSTMTERSVRFIPQDAESTSLYEVEVADMEGQYPTGKTQGYQWSGAEHKFLPKKGATSTPTKKH